MIYRILDNDGDYQFGRGLQNFTYGVYAVAQAIQTRLKLLKEEWFEDLEDGLPLFQEILGQRGTQSVLDITDSYIKDRIINTKDVSSIESYTRDYDSETRKYSFSVNVNTIYGTITVSDSY